MPCFLKTFVASARDVLRQRSQARARALLQATLDAAERVNPVPDFTDFSNNEYGALYGLMGPPCTGDGLWKCCKGHEQELIHWTGAYPFKYLKCVQCDHIFCRWCLTTQVLTPLQREDAQPKTPFCLQDQTLYGQICPNCGMSHYVRPIKPNRDALNDRIVTFQGVKCPCGLVSDYSWLQFKVGSIDHYRQNPYEAWFILTCQRAENSIRSRRASSERHARRSFISPRDSPSWRVDGRPQSLCLGPVGSDATTATSITDYPDDSSWTAWSLRLHEAYLWQDFMGRRPWVAPTYVVVDGL